MRLTRKFFEQPTLEVARQLLGKRLIRNVEGKIKAGRVVEVEAYLGPEDLASHSSRGRTPRTEIMFGPAGNAYVYLIYGMYHCLNIVTEKINLPQAVLIRALEPLEGFEGVKNVRFLANGPGKLCRWLEVEKSCNGLDLTKSQELFFEDSSDRIIEKDIVATTRIGVDYAKHYARKLWRFYLKGNSFVSKF